MRRRIVFCLLLFVFCANAETQNKQFHVRLSVESTDEALKERVYSYISRELRTIPDVEIDADGYFGIDVVAVQVDAQQGHVGIALAFVTSRMVLCPPQMTKESPLGVGVSVRPAVGLHLTSDSDLKTTCQEFVARFDATLERMRKTK